MIRFTHLRFDGVGTDSARFHDLTIPLDDPGTGEPSDSVIWIRNGGGKTSLLSLLFSLFLPAQRHFVWQQTEGRTLGDYVLNGDTSLVSARLSTPSGPVVCGAFYEWPDRRRPHEWGKHLSDLKRTWFVFRAHPGTFDLHHVSRVDDEDRPLRYRDLVARLEEISRGTPALRLMICKNQTEWASALDAHGIDTGLLEAQLRVAGTEGGFEQLFAVSTPTEFVDKLIDLLIDDTAAGSLSDRIEQFAETLRQIPAYQLERDFAALVADRLAVVEEAAVRVAEHQARTSERLRAADTLAAGLVAAAEAATVAAGEAECDAAEALRRRTDVYRDRNAASNHAAAFGRREALLERDRAERDVAALDERRAELRSTIEAWDAVEQVAAVDAAAERVAELRSQQEELEAGAEPQRQALARAAGLYRRRLDDLHAAAEAAIKEAGSEAEEAQGIAAAERDAERQHRDRAGDAGAQLNTTTAKVADSERLIAAARERGDVDANEQCETALARWRDAERTAHTDEITARERVQTERSAAEAADGVEHEARTCAGELSSRHALAVQRWQRLSAAHDALCGDSTVREVTGTNAPDLWAARSVLVEHLGVEAERLEVAAGDVAAEIAQVTRSIDALGEFGLLPARPDVSAIIEHLARAGVPASPGFAYLSRSVPRSRWQEVIASHPDIAAGVVVDADDFDAASVALEGLDVPEVVVVADKALLDVDRDTARRTVAGPLAAAYDPEAAPELRKTLNERRDHLGHRRSELRAELGRIRELSGGLDEFHTDTPTAAEFEEAHVTAASLGEELAGAVQGAEGARAERLAHLAAAEAAESAATDAAAERAEAAAAAARVEPLVEAEESIPRLVEEAEHLRATQANESHLATLAAGRALEAESARAEAIAAQATADGQRERLTSELAELGDDVAPSDESSASETATLRARWRSAVEDLRGAVTDTALASALTEAEGVRAAEQRRLDGRPADAISAARVLLGTDLDATDNARRWARVVALRAEDEKATRAHQAAGIRLDRWVQEVTMRPRPPGEFPEVDAVDDAAVAHERYVTEQERFEKLRAEANRLDEELTLSQEIANEQRDAADRLTAAAEQLTAVNADPARSADHSPWAGRPLDSASTASEVTRALVRAREDEAEWRDRLSSSVQTVRDTATEERFATLQRAVRGPVGDLDCSVLSEPDEVIRVRNQWRLRAAEFDGEIERADQHRRVCVGDLMGEVSAMCARLSRAETVSQLPAGLGDWEGHPFLRIKFSDPGGDPDQFRVRVGEAVDSMVARSSAVDGAKLLKMAVRAAVPEGFRVTILKPSPDLHATRVAVTELGQWSGGERLTAAVLLFCVVAAIRADRSGSRDASPGALIIDNPLGKASYRPFVALQRQIAERMGVQLLYTTGIKDMPAVGSFPNLVRCRNSRAGRFRYLRVEDRAGANGVGPDTRVLAAARVHRSGPAPDLASGDERRPTATANPFAAQGVVELELDDGGLDLDGAGVDGDT